MTVTTREESSPPLGVIGCLAAGFELVGQHLGLVALPVLLDLFLWLGPRLSVGPLVGFAEALMRQQPAVDADAAYQMTQMAEFFGELGREFNLFSMLSALPLLNVPTLLAGRMEAASPLARSGLVPVESGRALVGWSAVLIPVGLLLGFVYLNGLAGRVRAAQGDDEARPAAGSAPSERAARRRRRPRVGGLTKLVRLGVFAAGLLVAGAIVLPLWIFVVGAAAAIGQFLGQLTQMLAIGLVGYLVLHLMFVAHGVLLGGRGLLRALWESALIARVYLPYVMILVILVVVIYEGLGIVWSLPPGDSWSLVVGIVANGCVGTALTAATFVFYRERIDTLPGVNPAPVTGM